MNPSGASSLAGLMKMVLGATLGAGIFAAFTVFKGNWVAIGIMGGALVAALLLLGLLKLLFTWIAKRRSKPFAEMVRGTARGTPNAITNPAKRAALDDLRRNFDSGVAKFQAAGKDLYSLPWYVMIGEPGSGKTEAIRHCNVGFPPGLQDQLQGAGGTVNMNWWFTNHAVILDTAGRLMFEEVKPGEIGEWSEFLELLVRNRPNCPINGLLLVIPADSLIKDTADELERKGSTIAQQLDTIQRKLNVRFPVFVVITKCDLINGFREFFDSLSDPRLQHQILGWSNPAALDEVFDPEQVDRHIEQVRDRLAKRRLGLLLDPVNTDDPDTRRIDQVDSLYSFPDSMMKIAPRLRRYLEMIFVAGEWSPKPLFLRGIYFTSSVREGSALDAELAELMRVPVESLPEGRVWERERAYFLRDLFIEKVFRERGLVTRHSNTEKLQRRRRLAVLGTGFAAVLALGGITWYSSMQLEGSVTQHSDLFAEIAARPASYWSAVELDRSASKPGRPVYKCRLDEPLKDDADLPDTVRAYHATMNEQAKPLQKNPTLGDLHTVAQEGLPDRNPIKVPPILKPASKLVEFKGVPLDEGREDAYRRLYVRTVLSPLIDATRKRLKAETADTWSDEATAAMRHLIRLESGEAAKQPVDLEPLFRYALARPGGTGDGGMAAYEQYQKTLQDGLARLESKPLVDWLPPGEQHASSTMLAAATTYVDYCRKEAAASQKRLAAMVKLPAHLKAFQDSEKAISQFSQSLTPPPTTVRQYSAQHANWRRLYETLLTRGDGLKQALESVTAAGWKGGSLESFFKAERDQMANEAQKRLQSMLEEIREPAASTHLKSTQGVLKDEIESLGLPGRLPAEFASLEKNLPALDAHLITPRQANDRKSYVPYLLVMAMYMQLDRRLPAPQSAEATGGSARALDELSSWAALPEALAAMEKAIEPRLGERVATVDPDAEEEDPADAAPARPRLSNLTAAARNCAAISSAMVQPMRRHLLIARAIALAPKDSDGVAAEVAALVKANRVVPESRPDVLFTNSGDFDARFHPKAAARILGSLAALRATIEPPQSESTRAIALDETLLRNRFDAGAGSGASGYVDRYLQDWDIDQLVKVQLAEITWPKLFTALGRERAEDVNAELVSLGKKVDEAIVAIEPFASGEKQTAAVTQTREQIKRGLERLKNEIYVRKYTRVFRQWQNLPEDVKRARTKVLDLAARDFYDDYIVTLADAEEDEPDEVPALRLDGRRDYVENYWGAISSESLRILADAYAPIAQEAAERLKTMASMFPLRRSGAQGVLAPRDLTSVRDLLDQISLPGDTPRARDDAAAPRPGADPANKIAAGGRTRGDKSVNAELDRLCGFGAKGVNRAELGRLERIITAFTPSARGRFTCDIVVSSKEDAAKLQPKARGRQGAVNWNAVRLQQGDEKQRAVVRRPSARLGTAAYPGGAVRFEFAEFPQDATAGKFVAPVVFPTNEWGALNLLLGNAHPPPTPPAEGEWNGKTWCIELTPELNGPGGGQSSMWITVTFQSLPSPDDWK